MKRCFRITKNFEFINVYRAGRRWSCPYFSMYVKKNAFGRTRLGVSISKKVGKSVVRNRFKRRIKEIFRKNFKNIKSGFDVVISAKPEMAKTEYVQIEREIKNTLKRGRIWDDSKSGHRDDNVL